MNNDIETAPETIFSRHKFIAMILLSVGAAMLLVAVALGLYVSSGTEQLDLSRPGYASIRKQAQNTDSFQGFNASGPVDKAALDEFDKLYSEQLKSAMSVDAFGNDVLSPKSLQIDQKTAAEDAKSQQ